MRIWTLTNLQYQIRKLPLCNETICLRRVYFLGEMRVNSERKAAKMKFDI
jgi:hypothetical protein